MASLTRLRAHAGLWTLVALLGAAAVLVTASTGPVTTRLEDDALQQTLADAEYLDRDVVMVETARPSLMGDPVTSAETMRRRAVGALPPALREVLQTSWGFQRTGLSPFEGVGATLTGDGVRGEPNGRAPVVSLFRQPDLQDAIELVDGELPTTDARTGEIGVMVATAVAERLDLEVGEEYALHPGSTVNLPDAAPTVDSLTVRLEGTFTARDPGAPVWAHAPLLLEPTLTSIPVDRPPLSTLRAALVTDSEAFGLLFEKRLTSVMPPEVGARVRLDPAKVDREWPPAAVEAVAQLHTDPALARVHVSTRLPDLLEEYQRLAASARAVIAIGAVAILALLAGLLLLAAHLIASRRRAEWELVRARGGSLAGLGGRLATEGAWVLLPAAVAGWLLHRVVLGEPLLSGPPALLTPPIGGLVPAAVAGLAALLMVPVVGVLAVRRAGTAREVWRSSSPVRLTAELSVLVLAALGVVLTRQRGTSLAGVDLYLSAVPVLVAVAAGIVALRLYPWPLRLLAALARRLRGTVGFVALARAGRAAPGSALALLMLVLAVAVGGFAGAVNTGVAEARDTSVLQQVGAHARITGENLPAGTAPALREVPGVTSVAVADRSTSLYDREQLATLQGVTVVMVDARAYQDVLEALGAGHRLPQAVVSAGPGADPIPVLAPASVAERGNVVVRAGSDEYPVTVVGDTAGLPGPDAQRSWALVPRAALDQPGQVDELLVAGADAVPAQIRQAVAPLVAADEAQLTTLAGARNELESTGFNDGLTLVLVAGTVGGAACGVLAVALTLVVQARARGQVLSLLRTMGLSGRQARGLLLVELLPLTMLAVATGAAAGLALPLLLAPALGLDAFTGGVALELVLDPAVAGALAGLVIVVVAMGALVENAVNRRLGLGAALRVN